MLRVKDAVKTTTGYPGLIHGLPSGTGFAMKLGIEELWGAKEVKGLLYWATVGVLGSLRKQESLGTKGEPTRRSRPLPGSPYSVPLLSYGRQEGVGGVPKRRCCVCLP